MRLALLIVAIVAFVLVGLGVTIDHLDAIRLVALGPAALAASMLPLPRWGS